MPSQPNNGTGSSDYKELKKKYDDLQLRVTRFSVIEQELVHAKNKLDREVMIYRRMQEFNSRALHELNDQDFLKLITESLMDIFELEMAFVAMDRGNDGDALQMNIEGYNLSPLSYLQLYEHVKGQFNIAQSGKVKYTKVSPQDPIRSLIPMTSLIMTMLWAPETGITIALLGGITDKGSAFYEAIGADREAAFSVYSQQVLAHQMNRYKTQTIAQQYDTLSLEQSRISTIAQSFLDFGTSPEANIQRIIDVSVRLLSASCAVFESLATGERVHSSKSGYTVLPVDATAEICGYQLMQSSGKEILYLPVLEAGMLHGKEGWMQPFIGSAYLGALLSIDRVPIGTLSLFFEAGTPIAENIFQLMRILAASITVEERRKRALIALRESEEKYRVIFEGSPNGIIVFDSLTYQILYANPSLMALFGLTNEELLHMTIDRLHPSEDQEEIYGAIRKISSGMSIVGNEIVCLRKDGALFYCDIFSNAINIGGRELVAGFLIDVTQRRNDRKALLDSNNQLQKINAELDNFVYSVSHDLRSPLLAIQGLLNLIFSAAGEVNKDTQTYLSMIGSSVNRMDDTIKEILEYSRNSRLDVSVKAIDISQLIHEIFEDVKHIYPDSIKMEFSMEGEGLFYSDPYRINTLFKNIISNAVKYQRHGAEPSYLKVQAKMHAGQLLMRFEDNGEGIGETHIDKIFDMFYRASNTSVGTGLGLYICREIVNNLGGSISVVSTPGVGAVFTVTLKNLSPQP